MVTALTEGQEGGAAVPYCNHMVTAESANQSLTGPAPKLALRREGEKKGLAKTNIQQYDPLD